MQLTEDNLSKALFDVKDKLSKMLLNNKTKSTSRSHVIKCQLASQF